MSDFFRLRKPGIVFFWILTSMVFLIPHLYQVGPLTVLNTYLGASIRILDFSSIDWNPYLTKSPDADVYKYSPMFAWFFSPFNLLPRTWIAPLWGAINIVIFWIGLAKWVRTWSPTYWQKDISFKTPLFWAFLMASFELDGSIRYQQINPLIVGLVMLSFAYYSRQHLLSASSLSLAANFKIFPLIWFLPLAFSQIRWLFSAIVISITLFFFLPILIWGSKESWLLLSSWMEILKADSVAPGIHDFGTFLRVRGLEFWSVLVLRVFVALAIVFVGTWVWLADFKLNKAITTARILVLGLLAILILSPRTESPTYVLISPAYVFLTLRIPDFSSKSAQKLAILLLGLGLFFCSIQFNDLWPRSMRTGLEFKALGATFVLFAAFLEFKQGQRDKNSSSRVSS